MIETKQPPKNTLRRLGRLETWLASLFEKTHGTAQITFIASIAGEMEKKLFENALMYLSRRYPLLNCSLVLRDEGYYLVQNQDFKRIPIRYLEYSGDEWQQIVQDEVNNVIPTGEYLWRAALLTQRDSKNIHDVMITIRHSIVDGFSCVALIDALLFYLNNTPKEVQERPVPPPIENLYVPPKSLDKNLQNKLQNLDKIKPYQWLHQKPTPIANRGTHFKFETFTTDQVQKIHAIAKKHNVSINSCLNSAMLLSAQKLLGKEFNGGLSTPVSLRDKTNNKVDAEDVAFLCTAINTVHPDISTKTSFWQLATEYQQQLKDRIDALVFPDPDYKFHEIENSMKDVWDPSRNYFCYNFMVTNLGMLKFTNNSERYHVKTFRFCTNRSAGDNNMMLLVDSTEEGMFCSFGYVYPLITDIWAAQFVDYFKDYILHMENIK